MTSSLIERISLESLMNQGWQQVQQQVLELVKRSIEGLLEAERDQRIAARRAAGEKVYRWGYTVRKCWQTLWGRIEQVRVPRLRGREEIGLLEKYQRHALDQVLFALSVGGLSQRKVVAWLRQFTGGVLSPASLGAVLRQAQGEIVQRRTAPLHDGEYVAIVVDGIYLRYRRVAAAAPRSGVLLVAVGVRPNGSFAVLDWLAAPAETSAAYEALFTRLWQRGLQSVAVIVSDGDAAVTSAMATVYPAADHQLCLAHWFRNLQALTPSLPWPLRRKFRREFWHLWEALEEPELRRWARRFGARWRWHAPEMVEKFRGELHRVLAYLRFPVRWRHRLRTSNLAEGFFRHLRRYLSRFPGCVDAAHSEHVLGCFLLAAERMHA
ncbi:MAG: IS256 family transposase [Candidatus Acidiferrales bacterium]